MVHSNFIIYKPYGYLSQFKSNDSKQQSKKFLGGLYSFPKGIMSVGRLDEKSEGILLLTTNGQVSNYINSQGVEKEYYALVDGNISKSAIDALQTGVTIGLNGKKYKTKPCNAFKLINEPNLLKRSKKIRDARHGPISWVSITLSEGKFRQVRKMTAAVGFPTLRLIRVRIGSICVNNMDNGDVIKVENFKV